MSIAPASHPHQDAPVIFMSGPWVRVSGLAPLERAFLIQNLTLANPRRAQQMRYSGLPREDEPLELLGYQDFGDDLGIAPGFASFAATWLQAKGRQVIEVDDRPPQQAVMHDYTREIRGYQQVFIEQLLAQPFGTGVAPCGSGKTDAALVVMVRRACKWLIIVEKKELRDQWVERIALVTNAKGCVYKPQNKKRWDPAATFVVATVQALVRHPDDCAKLSAEREGVCVDEVHHAASDQFVSVLTQFDARYRIGLTATPRRGDGTTDLLYWYVGPLIASINRDVVEDAGHLLRPRLEVMETPLRLAAHLDLTGKPMQNAHRTRKCEALIDDKIHGDGVRLQQLATRIAGLAISGRSVIVPVDSIAYGYLLRDAVRLPASFSGVEFCHANPGKDRRAKIAKEFGQLGIPFKESDLVLRSKERKAMLARVAAGETRVLIATSLADEGLDLPILDCAVIATPAGSATRIEQQIGRACRPVTGKPQPLVVYVLDSGVSRTETVIDRDTGDRVEQVKRPLLARFKRSYYAVFRKMADVDEVAVRRILKGDHLDATKPLPSAQRIA